MTSLELKMLWRWERRPGCFWHLDSSSSKLQPKLCASFSCYESHERPLLRESPIVRTAGFHGTATKLSNSGPVRRGCTSECPGALQQSPFTAASSSTGHLRSAALHFSRIFIVKVLQLAWSFLQDCALLRCSSINQEADFSIYHLTTGCKKLLQLK